MFKFLKHNKLITLLIGMIGLLLVGLIASTLSWYQVTNNFNPVNVTSSVITQYFDSGSGTQASPFVITRPIHYYNLVRLQEGNEYQVNGTPFADAELWFQFGKKDLDGNAATADDNVYQFYDYNDSGVLQEDSSSSILNMNYYSASRALPPLGSSEHPFKGHIVGNDLTISHLHINGEGYSDIGIFGYVANGATISHAYYESPYIDAGGNLSSATSGSGHSSHNTHTYIGYLAGHVYNASATFSNVYVNNCELTNTTGNATEMINTYGYFGHVDFPSDVSADSASFAVEAKASDIYNAIDGSYASGTGQKATSRNTNYTLTSTNYTDAVTKSSSTYSMGKYSTSPNYPYSLSTIGYTGGDSVTKHVRYYIAENELGQLETTTTQLNSEPSESEWEAMEDGTYIYWSTSDECWYYAVVESETSQEQQQVTYNCFTVTYTYNNTTYYLKYNNATLVSTTTAPTPSTIDDYYFVFKPSEGSHGISEFTSNSNSDNVYIYSPAHQKYLHIQEVSSGNQYTPTFEDTPSIQFAISGAPTTTFTTMLGGYTDALFGESTVYSTRKISTNTATTFTLGTPSTRQSVTGYSYNLATSVSAGDTVAIAAGWSTNNIGTYNWAGYYVMSAQNSNQRSTDHVSITNNVLTIGNGCDFLLTTGSQSGTFNICDQSAAYHEGGTNSGYLYAAGNTSSNYIKTNTLAVAGTNADATISIDSSGYATIIFQGSASRDHLYLNTNYEGSYPNFTKYNPIFSCYASKSNSGAVSGLGDEDDYYQFHLPKLYKKTTVYGADETYSTSTQKTYTSSAISEQTITPYTLRIAPLSSNAANPSSYSNTPFNVSPSNNVVFNMNTSQVSYEASSESYWAKVTTQAEVTSGDKYLIVYENSTTAVSFNGNLSTLDVGQNHVDFTISDNRIDYSAATDNASFTITYESSSWYIKSHSGYYIGRSAASNGLSTSTTKSADYANTISIATGTAIATIDGTGGYHLRYNSNTGSSNERFRYYNTASNICLYKLVEGESVDATYIGDLVGNRYDPNRIDVVGPVSYNSTYYNFTATSSVTSTPTAGNKFYTTSYVNAGITIIVDKTGSRDLGHLIFTYEDASNTPFFKTNNNSSTSLITAGARDVDGNGSDNVHSYLLNVNSTTITSLAYCGLDSSGNIVALNSANLTQYVLVLGASSSTHIQNVQYTFINSAGNVGNFGSVDYRTATYNSNGTLSTASANAQVSSSAISLFYDVNTNGQVFDVEVSYNQSNNTYTVTATSSVATTITVFIYDNSAVVVVNGVTCYGSEVVPIAASS